MVNEMGHWLVESTGRVNIFPKSETVGGRSLIYEETVRNPAVD